ncbi:MAG: sigma factor-like helix-turn-helix DNA-binding protein, partial [Microcystis sp.]
VFWLLFVLDNGQPLPLAKFGVRLNISRERVRQIEREAIANLTKRRATIR